MNSPSSYRYNHHIIIVIIHVRKIYANNLLYKKAVVCSMNDKKDEKMFGNISVGAMICGMYFSYKT